MGVATTLLATVVIKYADNANAISQMDSTFQLDTMTDTYSSDVVAFATTVYAGYTQGLAYPGVQVVEIRGRAHVANLITTEGLYPPRKATLAGLVFNNPVSAGDLQTQFTATLQQVVAQSGY